MPRSVLIAAAMFALAGRASAQKADAPKWAFDIAAAAYLLPDSGDFVQPTLTADRGRVHVMVRYNYEDLETGSFWAGVNFAGGKEISWMLTPIAGLIVGRTDGVALGYQGSLAWWRLELSSESEYVFPVGEPGQQYIYTWSELSISVLSSARLGFVTQRTRLYESEREVQPGILAGFTVKATSFTGYVFNPGKEPTFVLAFNTSFDMSGGGSDGIRDE